MPFVSPRPGSWIKTTPAGIYCEPGDFHIDPVHPVPRAVITHGHGDHARSGNERVLATPGTIAIMQQRYGEAVGGVLQPLPYGETLAIGDVIVRLAPAGHVLGSAQIVLEHRGTRVVVSGDYKRRPDPTCVRFEPCACDIFITEATFGLPVFRHPPDSQEIDKLLHSLALFPERCHLVGVYALGKCQRLLALLRRAGYQEAVYLHGALIWRTELYESLGVRWGRCCRLWGLPAMCLRAVSCWRRRPLPPTLGRGGCPTRWSRWLRVGCASASAPRCAAWNSRW
jgi:putative mRNA 3-end processing factor